MLWKIEARISWFLKRPEIPERAGVSDATGDCVGVEAVTLKTKRLHSSSRRAVRRPSGDEMPFEPVGRRRQPSGAFGGDFLTEGNV